MKEVDLITETASRGSWAWIVAFAALGVPAISTDCPSGPSEILPPQNLVAVADIPALTEKINQLMSHPSQFNVPFNEAFLPQNVARQYLAFMGVDCE